MSKAARFNDDKPEMSQVFWFYEGLEALANHMQRGRVKYPDVDDPVNDGQTMPNFMLGGKPDQEYVDAAARHLARLVHGEWYDYETLTPHAAAIVWNMLALITLNHPEETRAW